MICRLGRCAWVATWLVSIFALAYAASAQTTSQSETAPKVRAELIAPSSAIEPGKPFTVGLRQHITPHWHTYWKNPGDSGEPTRITWQLPEGFKASAIRWPTPTAIPVGPLMNYGYSDTLLLPVIITPPANLTGPNVTLTAKAEWLVCEKICIPEQQTVSLTLPVAAADTKVPASAESEAFEAVKRAMPTAIGWPATVHRSGDALTLAIEAKGLDPKQIVSVEFFPEDWGHIEHAAKQTVTWHTGGLAVSLKRGEAVGAGETPKLNGVLVLTEKLGGKQVRNGFQIAAEPVSAPTTALGAAVAGPTPNAGTGIGGAGGPGIKLWQAILFALLGGMILNLMPCVLPILSLKVVALARHSGDAVRGGFAYFAGVAVSFALFAALLVGLRAAGEGLGWGFQFQSPWFVLAMIALFFALGLSMSGVFNIGGNVIGVGENLTRKSGLTGAFFTGVLASIAATPCTAPFMGAAIGYALTRPAIESFVVLEALAVGFALPIVILSVSGAAQRILPRPGPWMETLKQVLAFPLYATVVWLVWVLSLETGSSSGVLAAGIVLVGIGFAAWILGRHGGSPTMRMGIAAAMAAAVFAVAANVMEPISATAGAGRAATAAVPMGDATPYSAERVQALRAEGRPVFVNLTAAWCITCKVNERVALSTDGFRAAIKRHNIAYLKGDWTNRNDEIARILKTFGRAGVPLYLLYPADLKAKPIVLPQLLTEAMVIHRFASLTGTP